METIAEHQVEISLLPYAAKILDLGCRGFLFSNEMKRRGYSVTCVDCDPTIYDSQNWYYNIAITNRNGWVAIERSNDPQATRVNHRNDGAPSGLVPAMTLEAFSRMVHTDFWDFIKTDVEGSEYEIIMGLRVPPAKQIEVEFHRHTGIYGDTQVKEMVNKLESLGYLVASHEKTAQHGLQPNYWSSLFIL